MKFFLEGKWRWIVMGVVILLMGWLWVSWRNGWPPFGGESVVMPIPRQVIDSLTATGTPPRSESVVETLKQLTSTPGSAAETTSNTSVLDSLTPKK